MIKRIKSIFSLAVKKLKSKKHLEIFIAVIAIAVMLLIYFTSRSENNSKKVNESVITQVANDYCVETESKLKKLISSIDGAGKTEVIVSWQSSTEAVIAYVTQTNSNGTTITPQLLTSSGDTKPLVLKQVYPTAKGAIIVCEGGDNVKIKLDVISAVSAYLGIDSENVNVYAMTK